MLGLTIHLLGKIAGAGSEDSGTTTPDWGATATHTGVTGSFLLPKLLTAACDFATALGMSGALTTVGAVCDDGVMKRLRCLGRLDQIEVGLLCCFYCKNC